MVLEMADPTDATHFMYLIREASEQLGLTDEWFMKTLRVAPRQLKMWKSGMTPSIQERMNVYKELTKEVVSREASNSSSERPQDEEGKASSPGSSRFNEGDTGLEPEHGQVKAAS